MFSHSLHTALVFCKCGHYVGSFVTGVTEVWVHSLQLQALLGGWFGENSSLAMAARGGAAMVAVLYCCCWALVIQAAVAADGNSQFLDDINQYRISQSLPEFKSNTGATCVAQQVAEKYKGTPCSNTTGTGTVSGQELQLDESLLSKCRLQLVNVKDGFIGPSCVAAGTSAANAPKLAAASVTMSQAYTASVNDSKFVSAGVWSVDNQWYVLVLATNASGGNYVNQDLDPSSHAFALSVSFVPVLVLAFLASAYILG